MSGDYLFPNPQRHDNEYLYLSWLSNISNILYLVRRLENNKYRPT